VGGETERGREDEANSRKKVPGQFTSEKRIQGSSRSRGSRKKERTIKGVPQLGRRHNLAHLVSYWRIKVEGVRERGGAQRREVFV